MCIRCKYSSPRRVQGPSSTGNRCISDYMQKSCTRSASVLCMGLPARSCLQETPLSLPQEIVVGPKCSVNEAYIKNIMWLTSLSMWCFFVFPILPSLLPGKPTSKTLPV